MNKFDQIKMKVLFEQKVIEEKKKSGTFSKEDFEKWDYVDHVLHLLSRLELAEKALENIGDMIGEEFAEKTKERCSQALKQIRS